MGNSKEGVATRETRRAGRAVRLYHTHAWLAWAQFRTRVLNIAAYRSMLCAIITHQFFHKESVQTAFKNIEQALIILENEAC